MVTKKIFFLFLFCCVSVLAFPQKKKKTSGNPILPGWYADPEAIVYGDEYWIYPTLSGLVTADGKDPDTGKKNSGCASNLQCADIYGRIFV